MGGSIVAAASIGFLFIGVGVGVGLLIASQTWTRERVIQEAVVMVLE